MTPNRLNEILTTPLSVSDKEIDILETLTKEFPFFNLPHILLAKHYKEKQSYKYDQQIKKASLRTADRKWLFDYINNVEVEANVESRKLSGESQKDSVEVDENISEVINPVVPEEIEEPILDQLEEVENANEVVDFVVEQSEMQEPISEQIEVESVKEVVTMDVVQTQIEELDTKHTVEEETINETTNIVIEHKEVDASITIVEEKALNEVIEETKKVEPVTVESRKHSGKRVENIDTKLSFTDWLSQMSKPIDHEIKPKKKELVIEEFKDIVSHKKVVEEPILPKPVKTAKPTPAKTEESINIIDAFLKKNPSISQPKSEFFKAEKAAKRSLELEDDIVTETLASIYVKQGHIEQAIWAYEKLILKFPQKEAYFADLLNELKKQKE